MTYGLDFNVQFSPLKTAFASPTGAGEAIFLFIIHGCISIHDIFEQLDQYP